MNKNNAIGIKTWIANNSDHIPKNYKLRKDPKFVVVWEIVPIDGVFDSMSVKQAKKEIKKISMKAVINWKILDYKTNSKMIAKGTFNAIS